MRSTAEPFVIAKSGNNPNPPSRPTLCLHGEQVQCYLGHTSSVQTKPAQLFEVCEEGCMAYPLLLLLPHPLNMTDAERSCSPQTGACGKYSAPECIQVNVLLPKWRNFRFLLRKRLTTEQLYFEDARLTVPSHASLGLRDCRQTAWPPTHQIGLGRWQGQRRGRESAGSWGFSSTGCLFRGLGG